MRWALPSRWRAAFRTRPLNRFPLAIVFLPIVSAAQISPLNRVEDTASIAGEHSAVRQDANEEPRDPRNMASADVPLDSWVYAAFDQLIARGHVKSAHTGMRPWTRIECARLLDEAAEGEFNDADAEQLIAALGAEFAAESRRLEGGANLGWHVDSIYFRGTAIAGPVLKDGYHFGQTVANDYGRPYGPGFNAAAGISARAEAGPLSLSLQAEYQHAPPVASEPAAASLAAAAVDWTKPLSTAVSEIHRVRFLQGTLACTHGNVTISFGRQSLWLGSGHSGPLLFSSNAEPMTMLRISSVSPFIAPLFSRFLGRVQSEFFLARFSGQKFQGNYGPGLTSQPYLHGTKLSFHPMENLEIGAGFTAQFGGQGNPFTWGNFLRSFYSHRVGVTRNPAKRLSEFEFSYRAPKLRGWMQIYVDSMVIDEYSPVGSNRPAINPGVYLSRLPWLRKMDLRIEGVTTDLNVPDHFGPGAFYWDDRYHSGYTNNGNLIGSWIGRRGRGEQAWLTYHFTPRNQLQLAYRHNSVDKAFLAGGSLQDLSARIDWLLRSGFGVTALLQQERWHFPLLALRSQKNVMAWFQITYWPAKR